MTLRDRLVDELYMMLPRVRLDNIEYEVDKTLENPSFTRDTIDRYGIYCGKCGVCCEKVPNRCEHLSERGYCKIYNERAQVCRDWPYWEVDGDYGIQIVDYCDWIYKTLLYEIRQKLW